MNITGIEQGQGPLSQLANVLSSDSKPAIAVQRTEDEEKTSQSPSQTGVPAESGIRVEISRAAQALSQSQFPSQQGARQQPPSPLDR